MTEYLNRSEIVWNRRGDDRGPGSCSGQRAPQLDSHDSQRDPMSEARSSFYSNDEAADFLRLSPRTLEKYRVRGGGPPFRKLGRRVVYARADLEDWAGQRVCDSTSDAAWKGPQTGN